MADSIDIVIQDKVPDTIRQKLLNIATAALDGYNNVNKLQQALDQTAGNRLAAAAAQLSTAQDRVTASIGRSSAAARRAASDVNAFGETQADVAKRLAGVSAAAIQLERASFAATKAEAGLASTTQQTATAATASARAYTAQMTAIQRANAAAKAAGAGAALPGGSALVPVGNITSATAAMEGLGLATVGAKRELLVLVHEFVTGNFTRIPGSILVLGERMNGFGGIISTVTSLFTPLRLIILAVTVAIAAYEAIVTVAENTQRKFNDTLRLTQGISGLTYDSYVALATQIANTNDVTIGSSKAVVSALSASGLFQKQQIAELADSTIKLSKVTGESTDEITKDFIRMAESPAKYADEFQAKYKFISGALLTHIHELEEQGNKAEATRILSKSLYDYLQTNGPAALTGLTGAWNDLKVAISGAVNALFGSVTQVQKIEAINNQIEAIRKGAAVSGALGLRDANSDARIAALTAQRDLLVDNYQAGEQNAKAQSDTAANIGLASEAMSKLSDYGGKVRGNLYNMNLELTAFRKSLTDAAKDPSNLNSPKYLYALQNQAKIEAEIRNKYRDKDPANTAEQTRAQYLQKQNSELIKQAAYYDQIADDRNALRKADEIDIQLASKKIHGRTPAPLSEDERQQIIDADKLVEANKRVSQAIDSIYTQSDEIRLRNYGEASEAVTKLLERHKISAEEAAVAQRKLSYELDVATNPLFLFNKGIEDQTKLLAYNTNERQAQAALQAIENQQAAQGKKLSEDQKNSILDQTRALQTRLDLQRELDQIESQTSGARQKIQTEEEAVNRAYERGNISLDDYNKRLVDLKVQMANLNLSNGLGTFEDGVMASLGRIRDGFTNVTKGLSDSFGDFFKNVTDGFANSIGHAIVYGDSLRDSLRQVAQGALSELISALIKVGLQYVINQAIGSASLATMTAEQVAAASVTAAAWAPAAALVSLASFGANAIPADIALVETSALSAALAQLKGFELGGYTGDGPRKAIAGVVHGGEFVSNAASTARNRATLEAMNSGASVGGGSANIVIEDHTGGGVAFESAPSLTAGEVRLIARDEAAKTGPKAVASALGVANSDVSKALRNTHRIERINR